MRKFTREEAEADLIRDLRENGLAEYVRLAEKENRTEKEEEIFSYLALSLKTLGIL